VDGEEGLRRIHDGSGRLIETRDGRRTVYSQNHGLEVGDVVNLDTGAVVITEVKTPHTYLVAPAASELERAVRETIKQSTNKFCHNEICPRHISIGSQSLNARGMAFTDNNGTVWTERHLYRTAEGEDVYLCDTCHGASELLRGGR